MREVEQHLESIVVELSRDGFIFASSFMGANDCDALSETVSMKTVDLTLRCYASF